MPFEAGQLLGDYEVIDTLGTGGMGQVYRVRNVISKRVEALKALLPGMTADPDFAARFGAEIRTLATFDHPNIAQLRTAFQVGDQQMMVMEYVEGSTLDRLTEKGPLPQAQVIEIAKQVLSALSYAHARGVVHRDIKPANIMVTGRGVVKLMDFGIAKSASEHKLTLPGSTIGSLYYMSPEQVRGEAVDARSDVYSTGILLYELLSGRRPFRATTTYALLDQQLNETPDPLIEVNPAVPQGLNDVVLVAISKDPAGRFQTADAFAKALTSAASPAVRLAAAETVTASAPVNRPVPLVAPALGPAVAAGGKKSSRGAWILVGAIVAVLTLAGAAAIAPHFFRTEAKSQAVASAAPSPAKNPEPVQTAASSPPQIGQTPETQTQAPDTHANGEAPAKEPAGHASDALRNDTPAKREVIAQAGRTALPAASPEAIPPAAVQPAANQSSPPPAADNGPSEEEITHLQDELVQLKSRAEAVGTSLESLKQQQAADGFGLRQDIAGAYSRMNSYLHAADSDVSNRNLAAAHRHMEMADKEVSTLEKFFNK